MQRLRHGLVQWHTLIEKNNIVNEEKVKESGVIE